MPANSLLGQRKVTHLVNALASFVWDRSMTYADVRAVPGGGTMLQLPDEASNGDEYEWVNPDNSCGPGNVITIGLSALAIAAGVTIQGAPSQALTSPGTCGKVVFFGRGAIWQIELYTQGGTSPTGGEGGELVWRGGATPSPGIVGTGAQVAAALAASPVPLTVYVDSSAAPCTWLVATGTTRCKATTTFASYNAGLNNGSPADVMTINDGAVLDRVHTIDPALEVQCQCVTTSALTFDEVPAGLSDVFSIRRGASLVLLAGATVPAIAIAAASELTVILDQNVTLNTGAAGVPVISLGAASLLNLNCYEGVAFTGTNVITGPGGSTIDFTRDATVQRLPFVTWGFTGTVNETLLDPMAATLNAPWVAVNHGLSPFAAPVGSYKFAVDTSGGPVQITLGSVPSDRQTVLVAMVAGAGNIAVTPHSGTIADPNASNAQGATASITTQGATVTWQEDLANTRLVMISQG